MFELRHGQLGDKRPAIEFLHGGHVAWRPCCMAGTIKMFCIRMNILSHRNNIELFQSCNMAAMQNLYTNLKDYVYLKTFSLNSSRFLDAVRLVFSMFNYARSFLVYRYN